MKKNIGILVVILFSVVFGFAVGLVTSQTEKSNETVGSIITEAEKDAENHPGITKNEKLAKAMLSKSDELEKNLSQDQKTQYFNDAYVGFNIRTTIMTKNYCANLGEDISNYIQKFEDAHADITATVSKYFDFNKRKALVYEMIKSDVERLVKKEFMESSRLIGISEKELCRIVNTNADSVIEEAHFKKRMPSGYNFIKNLQTQNP